MQGIAIDSVICTVCPSSAPQPSFSPLVLAHWAIALIIVPAVDPLHTQVWSQGTASRHTHQNRAQTTG